MENLDLEKHIDTGIELTINYAPQLGLALLTLIIGLWIINRILKATDKALAKKFDPTLTKFIHSLASVGLKLILIISVLEMIGVETTSFIAILGAAGLAIGLALQGNLANFASGALILIFKPFKVGDFIEGGGQAGVVKEIQIFTTVLTTPDNRRVIIPNSAVTGAAIVNFSAEATRRVDFVFGIGYNDNIDTARNAIKAVLAEEQRILKDKDETIVISELADSSVNFTVRVWVNTPDYWDVYFNVHENMKKRFDAEGISIPFPQRDLHLYQENAA